MKDCIIESFANFISSRYFYSVLILKITRERERKSKLVRDTVLPSL